MHVLITGGAGFIGTHLAAELSRRGHRLRVVDSLSPQIHGAGAVFPPEVQRVSECIKGDVTRPEVVRAAIAGVDCVVHLAAETGMGQSQYEIANYFHTNVQGTAVLLQELARDRGTVRRILVSSSARIYGDGPYQCAVHGRVFPRQRSVAQMAGGDWTVRCPVCQEAVHVVPCLEDDERHPGSMYAVTKTTQEDMFRLFSANYPVEGVILRYQNVYGAGQALRNPYTGVLSVFCTRIRNGLVPEIFEDGEESRDFVYVTDIARGTADAVERPGLGGLTLNLGSGRQTPIIEVARLLLRLFDLKAEPKVTGMFRAGEVRHMVADIQAAGTLLAWTPEVDIEAGISKLVDWARTQPLEEDRSVRAYRELVERGLSKPKTGGEA